MRIHLAHIHAAERHASGVHVPEARHEARRRGLAAAGGAHERHRRAGRYLKAHVVKRRSVRALVGKAHVLEADGVTRGRAGRSGGGDHGCGQHLLDTRDRVRSGLERLGHEHHARHGGGDHGREDRVEREVGQKAREVFLAGHNEDCRRHEEDRDAVDDGERERLRRLAPLYGVVLREPRELLDGVMKRAEAVDRLLEDLDHRDAAHVLGACLVHLDERLHVARHEVHAAPAHHLHQAENGDDDRSEARETESPVKDEEQHQHADDHGNAACGVRELMGEKPLGLGGAAVHDAAKRAARVRVEVAETRVHEVVRGAFTHVGCTAEGREVRAHEAGEVDEDTRGSKAERPPAVCGDASGRAPVGGHGDEVARYEPDADVRAKAHEHRDGRERAAQVRERFARTGKGEQTAHGALAAGAARLGCLRVRHRSLLALVS